MNEKITIRRFAEAACRRVKRSLTATFAIFLAKKMADGNFYLHPPF